MYKYYPYHQTLHLQWLDSATWSCRSRTCPPQSLLFFHAFTIVFIFIRLACLFPCICIFFPFENTLTVTRQCDLILSIQNLSTSISPYLPINSFNCGIVNGRTRLNTWTTRDTSLRGGDREDLTGTGSSTGRLVWRCTERVVSRIE